MDDIQSSGSTTTGPATFAEAFAADASSASTATHDTDIAASTTADATVQPATDGSEGITPAQGEPPQDRWPDILQNARTKAREEAQAEWDQQFGWAKQIPQQDLQQAIDLARRATSQPIEYLQDFIKELQANPTYNAQLKSLAAKALGSRQANTEPQHETIPVQLEDGRVVQLVTADSVTKREAWLRQQMLAEAEQKFSPFTKTVEDLQAEKAALAKQQQVAQYVQATHTDVLTWPGMGEKANQAALAEALKTMRIDDTDPREVSLALNAAYRTHILPKLNAKSESSVLENLQRKAGATSVNPGSTASASSTSYKSFKDLPADMWR